MTEYWFKPKHRGIGAGVPISWKGWALFGGLVLAILSVPSLITLYLGYEGSILLRFAAIVVVATPFLLVAWKKTEGGWRWRSGYEDDEDESQPS
jgi:hypothetical protein